MDEVLFLWHELTEFQQLEEIQNNPLRAYHTIWNELSDISKDLILRQEDIIFSEYIDLVDDSQKLLLYCFNKPIMYDLDWDSLEYKIQNNISHKNIHFQYKKYWEKLTSVQKDKLCYKPYFEYQLYWDELTENQRTVVIRVQHKDFDFEKYWEDLTPEQSLSRLYDYSIEEYQYDKIIKGLSTSIFSSSNHFELEISNIGDTGHYLEIEDSRYYFTEYEINDLDSFRKNLLIGVLKEIGYEKITDPVKMFTDKRPKIFTLPERYVCNYSKEMQVYKYKKKFYMPLFSIYISDYSLVFREDKLKRILI